MQVERRGESANVDWQRSIRSELQRRSIQLNSFPKCQSVGASYRRVHGNGGSKWQMVDALGDRSDTIGTGVRGEVVVGPHGELCVALRRPRRAIRHDD